MHNAHISSPHTESVANVTETTAISVGSYPFQTKLSKAVASASFVSFSLAGA